MSKAARPAIRSIPEVLNARDDQNLKEKKPDALLSNAAITIDLHGSVMAVNALALQMIGCFREEIIGMHYCQFLRVLHVNAEPVSDPRLNDPIAPSVVAERSLHSVFGTLRRKNRSVEPIEFCVAPFHRACVRAGSILLFKTEDGKSEASSVTDMAEVGCRAAPLPVMLHQGAL